jgi:hypothetical protein
MNNELITSLNESLQLELPVNISFKLFKEKLSSHINHLIIHDFQKLVSFLYRIDVSESKLKYLLKENADKDASAIITDLVIERQLEKLKSRKQFSNPDKTHDGKEDW